MTAEVYCAEVDIYCNIRKQQVGDSIEGSDILGNNKFWDSNSNDDEMSQRSLGHRCLQMSLLIQWIQRAQWFQQTQLFRSVKRFLLSRQRLQSLFSSDLVDSADSTGSIATAPTVIF